MIHDQKIMRRMRSFEGRLRRSIAKGIRNAAIQTSIQPKSFLNQREKVMKTFVMPGRSILRDLNVCSSPGSEIAQVQVSTIAKHAHGSTSIAPLNGYEEGEAVP